MALQTTNFGKTMVGLMSQSQAAGQFMSPAVAADLATSLHGERPRQIGTSATRVDGRLYPVRVFAPVNTDQPEDFNRRVWRGTGMKKKHAE